MVIIRPHQTTVSLFSRHGFRASYPSIGAALKALGYHWISRNVGTHFLEHSHSNKLHPAGHVATIGYRMSGYVTYREEVYVGHEYVLRDDWGNALTHADFYDLHWERVRKNKRRRSVYATWNGEGPVPGTGFRPAGRHQYRHLQHMNARRAAETFKEDGEVPVRAKRGPHSLTNPWDDYYVEARRNNNWKRYRRTQWR